MKSDVPESQVGQKYVKGGQIKESVELLYNQCLFYRSEVSTLNIKLKRWLTAVKMELPQQYKKIYAGWDPSEGIRATIDSKEKAHELDENRAWNEKLGEG